jgi:hypothetical protein
MIAFEVRALELVSLFEVAFTWKECRRAQLHE